MNRQPYCAHFVADIQGRLVAAGLVFLSATLLPMTVAAANKVWNNTGTGFNSAGSWTGGTPGAGDVAVFDVVKVTNPNLSGNLTIQELNFSTTAASGYDLTSSNTGVKLTLSNTGTGTTSAINAANTSGTNTIDAPLVLSGAAAATQTFTQASGGTLVVNGVISSTNAVTLAIAGAGTVQFAGVNTYSGATTISGGILNIRNSSALGSTAAGTTVNSGATLQLQGGISVGAETLTINGTGATGQNGALVNVSGNNSYAGVITLGSASTIDSDAGTLTLSANIVTGGFATTFDGSGNITHSGKITGSGSLVKNGSGTLTLAANNTFTGGATINGGTAAIVAGSLGPNGFAATINAGTVEATATFSTSRNFTLGSAASTVMVDPTQTYTTTGVFSGTGALNKTGTGTLVLSGSNTYTGATNINAGMLQEGAANVIADTSAVTVATGATYDLNSFSETIGSLAGAGTVTSGVAGAVTLTTGADNTSTSFSGVLQNGSGTIALTKSGTGTLTLSGTNTYSGGTTVNAGTLLVSNTAGSGTGTGAVVVNNSGTLGGTGTITGAVTLNNSAVLNPGPSGANGTAASVGTLSTGALTLAGTNIFHVDAFGTLATQWDQLNVTGGVTLGTTSTLQLAIASALNFQAGSQYTLINNITAGAISGTLSNAANGSTVNLGGYDFTVNYASGDGNDLVLTAVPEPSTWVTALLALAAIAYTPCRRGLRSVNARRLS
jgi:fibronectin-binding autotransporter adhesin